MSEAAKKRPATQIWSLEILGVKLLLQHWLTKSAQCLFFPLQETHVGFLRTARDGTSLNNCTLHINLHVQ
jgi:hypothetical protein